MRTRDARDARPSSIARARDRVDERRGTHAREHARSTTSARARIVESSPSARAIVAGRGRANRDDGDARQRQRARGDRDDDGARATRRAMDAR
jgi:hypothetical protein